MHATDIIYDLIWKISWKTIWISLKSPGYLLDFGFSKPVATLIFRIELGWWNLVCWFLSQFPRGDSLSGAKSPNSFETIAFWKLKKCRLHNFSEKLSYVDEIRYTDSFWHSLLTRFYTEPNFQIVLKL